MAPTAASSRGRTGNGASSGVKQLKRKLTYAVSKANQKAGEVDALKKANAKLGLEIAKEVRCGQEDEKKHRKEVGVLKGDIDAAQERLKERCDRFAVSQQKLRSELNSKLDASRAEATSLKQEMESNKVSAQRQTNIQVALAIREGKDEVEECRRSHALAWERREASFDCIARSSTFCPRECGHWCVPLQS